MIEPIKDQIEAELTPKREEVIRDMKDLLIRDHIYLGELQTKLEYIAKSYDANDVCLALYRNLVDRADIADPALTRLLGKHQSRVTMPYVTGFYDHLFFLLAMINGEVTPIPVQDENGMERQRLVIMEEAVARFARMRPEPLGKPETTL